jgi:hypothetical protein
VSPGGSFTTTLVGADFTDYTYLDVPFQSLGSVLQQVATKWQRGKSATHMAPASTTAGTWIVTGERAHTDMNDHSGDFVHVTATLKVTPLPAPMGF